MSALASCPLCRGTGETGTLSLGGACLSGWHLLLTERRLGAEHREQVIAIAAKHAAATGFVPHRVCLGCGTASHLYDAANEFHRYAAVDAAAREEAAARAGRSL